LAWPYIRPDGMEQRKSAAPRKNRSSPNSRRKVYGDRINEQRASTRETEYPGNKRVDDNRYIYYTYIYISDSSGQTGGKQHAGSHSVDGR